MNYLKTNAVDILGTPYRILMCIYDDQPRFKELNCDAWISHTAKEIVLADPLTHPTYCNCSKTDATLLIHKWIRHEIIHAYFYESGLDSNSVKYDQGWATNEELVDWMAIQLPKIARTLRELGVLW